MIRTGIGYDVHRFSQKKGDYTIKLGNIDVPCQFFIIAHSDGDVLLHALTDAMLGCIAAGDIGDHFPPTDDRWKDASSVIFVKHALKLIKAVNGYINNIDINVICQTPKLMDYKKNIKYSVADILQIDKNQINIKATTTEKLGFTGRGEGIAVEAVCTLEVR